MRKGLDEVAQKAGKESGFVQRASKMGGAEFVQTLTFGWLSNPQATLEELAQTAATVGVKISAQGLDQRFSEEGAACLKQVLDAAVVNLVQGEAPTLPILQRFSAVYVQDSSVVELPETLAEEWRGCGNASGKGQAGMKIEVRFDLLSGAMVGPLLEDARIHDAVSAIQTEPVPANTLRIADLGYWSLAEMQQIDQGGGYWLSRVKSVIKITTLEGKTWDILEFLQAQSSTQIDCSVYLSAQHPTPARFLAVRVPQEVADQRRRKLQEEARRRRQPLSQRTLALADWTILVTNVPQTRLSLTEALILLRSRWQIELLFKLWKSHGHIDEWRSTKTWRILCEVYAKLLAMLIQHWLFLVSFWRFANRSWVKATQTIRKLALHLASAFSSPAELQKAIQTVVNCLESGCRINKRKTDLRTFQLLQSLSPEEVLA
jgi:hypothetical protein